MTARRQVLSVTQLLKIFYPKPGINIFSEGGGILKVNDATKGKKKIKTCKAINSLILLRPIMDIDFYGK